MSSLPPDESNAARDVLWREVQALRAELAESNLLLEQTRSIATQRIESAHASGYSTKAVDALLAALDAFEVSGALGASTTRGLIRVRNAEKALRASILAAVAKL